MKEFKNNLMLLLIASLFGIISFSVNKFLEASLFLKICEFSICISPFEFTLLGMTFIFLIIFISLYV